VQLLDHWAEADAAITALIETGAIFVGTVQTQTEGAADEPACNQFRFT